MVITLVRGSGVGLVRGGRGAQLLAERRSRPTASVNSLPKSVELTFEGFRIVSSRSGLVRALSLLSENIGGRGRQEPTCLGLLRVGTKQPSTSRSAEGARAHRKRPNRMEGLKGISPSMRSVRTFSSSSNSHHNYRAASVRTLGTQERRQSQPLITTTSFVQHIARISNLNSTSSTSMDFPILLKQSIFPRWYSQ